MLSKKIETRLAARMKWPSLRRSVMGTRLIGRSHWSIAAGVSPELPAKRMPLFGRHAFPPLPHLMTFFGRQGSEPLPCGADGFALLRWQIAKSLEPLAQLLLLVLGYLLPLLKPLPGLVAFLRLHVGPLTRPVAQPFLPFGRQLVPVFVERLERLLFVLAQLMPRHS